jgi:HTH-type transcriptional regulator/antitoxin HigA
MIENEHQYRITQTQADRLRRALAALPTDPAERPAVDPRLQQAERDSILDTLEELSGQMTEYEMLQSGQRTLAAVKYLDELPRILVSAREAAGMTPADLASRLDITERQMLELEQTAYASATLPLITRTMNVLGIRLRDGINLSYPVEEGWIAAQRATLTTSAPAST